MGWVEELQQYKSKRPMGGSRAELEIENMRLTQLVGELLLKNQRLRDCN
jgi:hypothetical protein